MAGLGRDRVGHVDVAHLSHTLPDGRQLIADASFRVGEGTTAALAGPNGAGKTTLIRLIAKDIDPQSGTVAVSGGLGVMRQFIGGIRGVAPPGKQSIGGSGGPAPRVSRAPGGPCLGPAGGRPGPAGRTQWPHRRTPAR
jgi:hypothetical protein